MATGIPNEPSERLTRAVRNVARLKGRAPEQFTAGTMPNGTIWVRGPGAVAIYPPEGWRSKFARHLVLGIFDRAGSNG